MCRSPSPPSLRDALWTQFFGVADLSPTGSAWSISPATGTLYISSPQDCWGQERDFNDKINEDLNQRTVGVPFEVIVDMTKRKLFFAVDGKAPVDAKIELPEGGVRPWVLLGHEGDVIEMSPVVDAPEA